jgi:hypothetical protein
MAARSVAGGHMFGAREHQTAAKATALSNLHNNSTSAKAGQGEDQD